MIEIESQVLLNSFPHAAMIIGEDRKILAANEAALGAGAEIGGYCWKSFGNAANLSDDHYQVYLENPDHLGIQCVFCRADNCLINEAEENDPFLQSDVGTFDTYWVPISRNTYLHFAIDITEREQSKELLRQSEERLRLVLKGSNDAPWDWDLVRDELYYSPQWWQQIGFIPDEVPADSALWNRLLHPDDKKRIDDLFSDALKSNTETYEVEFRLLHKNGHYVPVLSRGYISRDENNKPIRVTGTNTDLTGQKNKEEELLKSQQLLTQMGRISQVGGWAFDFENEILDWTDEVYKIHEVDSGYVPNVKDAIDFYSDESKPLIGEAVQRAIEYAEPFDLELEIITAKGNHRIVHSLGIPDSDHGRIYGTFQDITNRKKIEEDLRKKNKILLETQSIGKIGTWELNFEANELSWAPNCRSATARSTRTTPVSSLPVARPRSLAQRKGTN